MEKEHQRRRRHQFSRRSLLLLGGQGAIMSALGFRMYQLQVVESDAHLLVAEENRINQRPIPPVRGEIFDRTGAPLALNRPNYRLNLVRERIEDLEATIADLRRLITLDDDDLDRFHRQLKRNSRFVPVLLRQDLSWDEFARVNANAPALPGVQAEMTWIREYPDRDATPMAHVIGYVSAVNEKDLQNDRTGDPSLRLPEARIGKNGVEKAAELRLRGAAGVRKFEINAAGREIREIERIDGARGEDLGLTIDAALQRYAMERLAGESAAAVVMDVWNGDLLAIASAPAYDPNKFVFGISHGDWNALSSDPYDPLRNKAIAGGYPPGSTFKMMTSLAALEHGVMGPNDSVQCNGRIRFGNRNFHCWKRSGHGRMDLRLALKRSCDIYFYEAAKRVGIDRLAEMSRRFGLGERFDLEIPNIARGVMPDSAWKLARIGEPWQRGETLIAGIGQGFVLTTPLQLAVMTARIANGSEQVQPRLIRSVNGQPLPVAPPPLLGVDRYHMGLIQDGMNAVSNVAGGTAYRSRIDDQDHLIAGKTGTAQVRRITRAEREAGVRKNEDLPWHLRDHALFVAFAPYHDPRYAISVVVEHGGSGSKAAAPIARDIMMRALYGGEPPLDAYPAWARAAEKERREQAAGGAPAPGLDEDARLRDALDPIRGYGGAAVRPV